MPFSANIRS